MGEDGRGLVEKSRKEARKGLEMANNRLSLAHLGAHRRVCGGISPINPVVI